MSNLPRLELPRLDTSCRTTSMVTSIGSSILRDRFWEAFQFEGHGTFDRTKAQDKDAHGPSAYRGLSAIERICHLKSALCHEEDKIQNESKPESPAKRPQRLSDLNVAVQGVKAFPMDALVDVEMPASMPTTAASPDDDLSTPQDFFIPDIDAECAASWPDSRNSELHWASLFLNHWATSNTSQPSTPRTPTIDEEYTDEIDLEIVNELLGDGLYLDSDWFTEGVHLKEICERPKSPKVLWSAQHPSNGRLAARASIDSVCNSRAGSEPSSFMKSWYGQSTYDPLIAAMFDDSFSLSRSA